MKITKYELEQVLSYLSYADKMMALAKVQKSQVMQTEAIQNAQEALFDLKHFLDFNISEVLDDDKASKPETFAEHCARDITAEEKIAKRARDITAKDLSTRSILKTMEDNNDGGTTQR